MDDDISKEYNTRMTLDNDSTLQPLVEKHGFAWWGVARLERPHTFEIYKDWVESGQHGEMEYLSLHLPQKQNPQLLLPDARTAIVVAVNYLPHPAPQPKEWPFEELKVARYARGQDYHHWLKTRLDGLAQDLGMRYPGEVFLAMTDSRPVLERDLGQRAGLGWFGKNTCLIHPKRGSFFLIGEIYTSMDLVASATAQSDHCGSCRRCLDACPTQALTAPHQLDARLCISYWTIEARGVPPVELRPKLGDWFFGCDICQEVCPWNQKVFREELRSNPKPEAEKRERTVLELQMVFESSNKKLGRMFEGSALSRAGGRGLKRNAVLVAARLGLVELAPTIAKLKQTSPELEELCLWALTCLNPNSSPGSDHPPA